MKKRKNLILYVVFLGLMLTLPQTANAWLTGWQYQREITLDTATIVDSFQVKVELTSANFDYSHTLDNGEDIRFTDTSDVLQDYWIEEWNASGTSTLWVAVATSGTTTFYMYYNNPLASSTSDGDATFLFFDDFEGSGTENWTRYPGNPVLSYTPGTWDASDILFPNVIKIGIEYYLYYSGSTDEVGLATSPNGKDFTKICSGIGGTSKVLAKGTSGEWDDDYAWGHAVVYHNSTFYMFYTGRDDATGTEDIGVATSSDGINFSKYANNPILYHGGTGWRQYHLCHMDVVWDTDNNVWIMLVSGMQGSPSGQETIGRYYCSEAEFPYTWHEDAGNPVIDFGTQPGVDDYHCYHPKIFPEKVDGLWYVYYTSATGYSTGRTISRATTGNLYTGSFTKDIHNPIITQGTDNWENSQVVTPSLKNQVDGKYALYYAGQPTSGGRKIGLIQADNIDDFNEYAGLNTEKWNVFQGTTPIVNDSKLDLHGSSSASGIDSYNTFSYPIALHTRSYWSEGSVLSTHYHALRSYGSWSYRVCDMYSTAQDNECAIYSY
ncbi:MAG: DUF2341 domain-containing protein, partial [Bacteroidota bacterium]|nr:DUF2341 domain-containing protein [Bacteroidota bacterium]